MTGRLDEHVIKSEALRGNPLGDPHERPLWVYTPQGYAGGPTVYVLQGFTGELEMWRNRAAFRPTFLELLDREDIDARVVFVDAWTSVGGSQFIDSNGSGRYHTYLCDEIVPFVDERYDSSGFRGVAGKSSGGYGAAVTRDAPSRPLLRLREPRRRRPLRGLDPPVLPASRRGGCATRTRARSSASSRSSAAARHRSPTRTICTPAPVGLLAAYSADEDGTDPPPVRHRDCEGDPGALGTLARVGLSDAWSRATPMPCAE